MIITFNYLCNLLVVAVEKDVTILLTTLILLYVELMIELTAVETKLIILKLIIYNYKQHMNV